MNRINQYMQLVGETLVVVGSALWITQLPIAVYTYVAGAVMMAIGRFAENHDTHNNVALRRMYRQRNLGVFLLLLSAVVMNVPEGFYYGAYVGKQAWLIPFLMFVVFEVYTTFRISYLEKKIK